jgi:hypothetical protein
MQIDKSIEAMYKRLQKTLTSFELIPSLWEKCEVSPQSTPITREVYLKILNQCTRS